VKEVKPTILLGLSGAGRCFTEPIIREMAQHCEQPIIFPLSNPTSKAECTFEEAITWTEGRAIFASGSPFKPVQYKGKTFIPSQGNNMYIFPGLGLGSVVTKSKRITDEMLYEASLALAKHVSDKEIAEGRVYPKISDIREVSLAVATAVVKQAIRQGVSTRMTYFDDTTVEEVRSEMYVPHYAPLVSKK